jgi:hypothetical protein
LIFEDFMKSSIIHLCFLSAIAITVRSAKAQTFVAETFESGINGWSIFNDANGPIIDPAGGNPGACLKAVDQGRGIYWGFLASPAFLGDRSCAYGGTLAWQHKTTIPGAAAPVEPDVRIDGAGLILVFDLPSPATAGWIDRRVTLNESAGWRRDSLSGPTPTRDEFRRVLASITAIRFRGEFASGPDIGWIDNVLLSEGPVSPPRAVAACPTGNATFSVTVPGPGPYTFAWRKDRAGIDAASNPSAATATLTLTRVGVADAGSYDCVVTDSCVTITTDPAILTVRDCPYGSCFADYDGSGGTPDVSDIGAFFTGWLAGESCADTDCTGGTPDSLDITTFFTQWLAGEC